MDFKDKIILVTGAANGIGRDVALNFAKLNGHVIIADIDKEQGEELIYKIKENNKKADFIYFNVLEIDKIDNVISNIINKYKKVDVLVNNAGICPKKHSEDIDIKEWDEVMRVNLTSVFFIIKKLSTYMKNQRYGKIVNISSVAAKMGGVNVGAHYVASKGGVEALTRYFAKDLAQYNINVNAISPATTITNLINTWDKEVIKEITEKIPLKRLASVTDIANAVLFLSSDESSFITGEVINVNGGMYMN